MIVSINQPAYLPWLGYFHRIGLSDVHVILDHVQFEKNSFTNRNKIRTGNGHTLLTLPLKTKGLFGNLPINAIEMFDRSWQVKHLKSIQNAYSKARYFKMYEAQLVEFYAGNYTCFFDLVKPMNEWLMKLLDIRTMTVLSSNMDIHETKSDLVLAICKSLKATTYLSGPLGRDYLDIPSFTEAGIAVVFHDYVHPEYSQVYNGFEPYMTVLDLLMNHGPESNHYLNLGNEKLI